MAASQRLLLNRHNTTNTASFPIRQLATSGRHRGRRQTSNRIHVGEIMKRTIASLVLSLLTFAGIACSQSGAQDKSSSASPTTRPITKTASDNKLPSVQPAAATPSIPAPALKSSNAKPSKEVTTSGGELGIKVPHGLVTLIGDVKVPAAETGSLIEIKVKEGDTVEFEQVLAVIDNRDTLAKREMAQGELAVAEAQAESTAELEAAQKAWEVAKAELAQFESIRRTNPGAVSEQEVRRARFQVERAMAQIRVAETDRIVAGLTTGVKKAQLNATDNELTRREIRSPLKGEVVEIYKKQGEWVQPGEPVMRIVSLDKLYVEGFVNADQASAGALEGKRANVTVKVFDPKSQAMIDHNVKGEINYASPLVEGSGRSRQFRVRAEVENTFADNRWIIQPGAMAEMTIELTNSAPIRATGSTSGSRSGSTPVSTGAADEKAPAADTARSRTSPSFPRLSSPSGREEEKVETLKPVTREEGADEEEAAPPPVEEVPPPKREEKKATRPF